MTQKSYFHTGTTYGDSVEAPYTAKLFSDILNTIYASDEGYIVPGYLTSMGTPATGGSGAAYIKGVLYIDTANALISNPTSNFTGKYRIDRAVIRVDRTNKTVKKYLKQGIASDYPEPPDLIQSDDVYEIPLWQMYVDPTGTPIIGTDERKFANTTWHSVNYTTKNRIANGEFMAVEDPPAYWTALGSPTIVADTQFEMLPRGYSLNITAPTAADGIQQTIRIGKPTATVYTFKCVVRVESGTCYIAAGTENITVYPSRKPKVIMLRGSVAVATNVDVIIRGNSATGNVFNVGGVSLTQGYIDCPFEPQHETILLSEAKLIASGDGTDEEKSILSTYVPAGTKAILAMLRVSDSNSSAASNVYASIKSWTGSNSLLRVDVGRDPNNAVRYNIGWIPIETLRSTTSYTSPSSYEIYAESTASGTLSWSLYLLGLIV